MKPTITALSCFVIGLLTACGGAAAQSNAKAVTDALTGEEKLAADHSPQCRLFTPAELARYAGEPLGPGRVAAMGTGCQWLARGDASVLIQVAPARYHEPHKGAPGFRQLPEIGSRGFVEQSLGAWNAGAISGEKTVVVSVRGKDVTDATAIALLKETIARRSR
jgi:hypothetical protein